MQGPAHIRNRVVLLLAQTASFVYQEQPQHSCTASFSPIVAMTLILTIGFSSSGIVITQIPSIEPRQVFAASNITGDMTVLPGLYKKVENSVVQITAASNYYNGTALGSGFVYDREGHIITNNHVVNGSNTLFVTFTDGTSYSTKIIGTDPYSDLAVLQLDPSAISSENPNPLPLANSSNIQVGEQVVAIGNPLGLAGSMSYGIISQLDRPFSEPGLAFSQPGFIQIDAAVNPGNSGGPLFNFAGEVIGITTGGIGNLSAGVNFALPSDTIQRIVPQLISNGTYKHPWLGVYALNIDPVLASQIGLKEASGIIVSNVTSGTPAQLAGIAHGDIIVGIDNKQVRKLEDMLSYIETKSVGDTVLMKLLRNGNVVKFDVKLAERPSPSITKIVPF